MAWHLKSQVTTCVTFCKSRESLRPAQTQGEELGSTSSVGYSQAPWGRACELGESVATLEIQSAPFPHISESQSSLPRKKISIITSASQDCWEKQKTWWNSLGQASQFALVKHALGHRECARAYSLSHGLKSKM